MKNLILIAATWLAFSGCTKSAIAPQEEQLTITEASIKPGVGTSATDAPATVEWTADPAVDGLGWVLRLSDGELAIPRSIPEIYLKHGTRVIVSFKNTGEPFPCRCTEPMYYVEITAIKFANPKADE